MKYGKELIPMNDVQARCPYDQETQLNQNNLPKVRSSF